MDCLTVIQKERLLKGGTGENNKHNPGYRRWALNRNSIGKNA